MDSVPRVGRFSRILRRCPSWVIPLGALIFAATAHAHGPFDHSSRLFLYGDRFEITVTMGSDAARQVLANAAVPASVAADALKRIAPAQPFELPTDSARHFFEVTGGGKALSAEKISVVSDGLDFAFTLRFARPQVSMLEIRARYFDGIESMGVGSFIAVDDEMHELSAALLSRSSASVQVPLPDVNRKTITPGESGTVRTTTSPRVVPAPHPSFREFLTLGIRHILTGFDHLLFLGALLVGVRKLGPMLGVITSFTLAHSVTLALAALNIVTISSRIVEPLIALSIIVVAVENLVRRDHPADRYWLAGGFGLIHGFGFASVLRDTGLAQSGSSIAMPLFSFNLGVEAGQLAVAAVVVPLLFVLGRSRAFARYGSTTVSAVVILVSGYWLIERTLLSR